MLCPYCGYDRWGDLINLEIKAEKMMEIRELFKIDLKPGETVVAAVPHRDEIVVITDRGTVYKISRTEP